MSPGRRKRRALVLLALALACGGLAASRVQTREREVEAAVGPLVPVVVTRSDLAPGARLKPQQLAIRQVPERFAPRDGFAAPEEAAGQRIGAGLPAGGYVTAGALGSARDDRDGGPGGAPVRRGERTVDLAVAGGEDLTSTPPGTRVDVIVTTEPHGGAASGRTYLALQDVELLAARGAGGPGAGGPAAAAGDGAAAQSFAREIRLLTRAPGDKREVRALTVPAGAF